MDEDKDLDCLIGDEDGTVHYIRNDGNETEPQWTYVTRDYFESDVGSHASPWCGFDYSGLFAGTNDDYTNGFGLTDDPTDIKCLVGNKAGYVQIFKEIRDVASAPSFEPSPMPTLRPCRNPVGHWCSMALCSAMPCPRTVRDIFSGELMNRVPCSYRSAATGMAGHR